MCKFQQKYGDVIFFSLYEGGKCTLLPEKNGRQIANGQLIGVLCISNHNFPRYLNEILEIFEAS